MSGAPRALVALMRRDLVAGGRGAITSWARALACIGAAAPSLGALEVAENAGRNDAAAIGALMLFTALVLAGFALAPAFAVSALRREREAGMLDLLLLAGMKPSTLTLGRILSTFLMLESMLLAALPGLALFWFFRSPSLVDLGLITIVVSAHFLALAAVTVAISAVSKHAGYAIALTVTLLGAWVALLIVGLGMEVPSLGHLLRARLGPLGMATPSSAGVIEHLTAAAWLVAIAAGAWWVATAGLVRTRSRITRDRLREVLEKKPIALGEKWPLTWLLRRGSAPARPSIQIPVIVGIVFLSLVAGPEVCAIVGALLVATGQLATLGLAATAIAPARERGTWTSLLSTALPGKAIVLDLLHGVLLGSVVPMAAGILLTIRASLSADEALIGTATFVAACGMVTTWLLTAAAGLASSMAARTTAGALMLAACFVFGEPILASLSAAIFHEVRGGAFASTLGDTVGAMSWLALVAAAAFGGAWLILRAGWMARVRMAAAMLPTALLCLLPFFLGAGWDIGIVAPFVAAAAAGLAMLVGGLRRYRPVITLVGILFVMSCLIVPLSVSDMSDRQGGAALLGGTIWIFQWFSFSESYDPLGHIAGLAVGMLHHLLLANALAACFMPRIDRWLGRAG